MIIQELKILLLFTFLMAVLNANILAQEAVTGGGEEFKGEKISICWTLGEIIVETFQGETYTLTQGFHQPTFKLTHMKLKKSVLNSIRVYPNPFSDFLIIECKRKYADALNVQIVDENGKIIVTQRLHEASTAIDTKTLKGPFYILNIQDNKGRMKQTFKLTSIK